MSAALSPELVALILFGSLLVMFLMKVPIAFSLILSSVLVLQLTGIGLEMVPKRLFTSCDSFSFMAVPFFILAGSLMSQGGISERLCTFINSIFGRFPGGLGIVAIVATAMTRISPQPPAPPADVLAPSSPPAFPLLLTAF